MPFTSQELSETKAVTGAIALMMPFVSTNRQVPGKVVADIRNVMNDLGENGMVVGAMKSCDVAIKTLARVTDKSLTEAGNEIGEVVDRLRPQDSRLWRSGVR